MPPKRNLLGKPRKLWGLCKAPTCAPNVATHKTGYCDFHHAEYSAAKKRHNDMKYNFKSGRSSQQPPLFEEFLAQVAFSPTERTGAALDVGTRSVLEGALDEVSRGINMASSFDENKASFLESLERVASSLRQVLQGEYNSDQPTP